MSALPHDFSLGSQRFDFGSKNEEYVYRALLKYEISFQYQVPLMGGRMQRGGLVLDFLVYNPFKSALQVYGNYWHRTAMRSEDEYELQVLSQIFGNRIVILWGDETDTYEEAEDAVRKWIVERPGASKY